MAVDRMPLVGRGWRTPGEQLERHQVMDVILSVDTALGGDDDARMALQALVVYVTRLESVIDAHDAWGEVRRTSPNCFAGLHRVCLGKWWTGHGAARCTCECHHG